ncbi:hypothetical protein [Prevotella sp.]|nr:hypothetical protein [Prevotella sp.]
MEKKFDFNQIGKRMPYSTPDNFFDKLEKEVKASLPSERNNQHARIITMSVLSIAASLLLLFGISTTINNKGDDAKKEQYNMAAVEKTFNNLDDDDQNALINIYQDDVFTSLN